MSPPSAKVQLSGRIKKRVEWLRKATATIDEVALFVNMVAGVAVSQLVDPSGNRIAGVSGVDWIRAVVGVMVAVPHLVLAEQGDRSGKTKSLIKMLVRYAHAFSVGFTWTTLAGMATHQ